MTTNSNTGPTPEPLTQAGGGLPAPTAASPRAADGPWLRTPSGMVALGALVVSVIVPPAFFPLALLALVLAVIALVRRRPRPRSALVITIISSVLLVVVLAVGILATMALFEAEGGLPSPAPAVSVPAGQP